MSQGRYLHTGLNRNRTNAHIHLCLYWDSNTRFQCFEGAKLVHALVCATIDIGIKMAEWGYIQ
jgi:hypothetical protein